MKKQLLRLRSFLLVWGKKLWRKLPLLASLAILARSPRRGAASSKRIVLLKVFLLLLFLLPVISITQLAFFPGTTRSYDVTTVKNIWQHLFATTLPSYIFNSFALILLTGGYSFILGVSSAWVVSRYRFYTRNIVSWGLVLPFSIPTYIAAYIYADLLDYSGVVQIFIRNSFNFTRPQDYYFPAIRSLGGASIIMALALYPYVYLLARQAFFEHSASLARAQQLMGLNGWRGFFKISFPLARPAIAVGVILVILETLNDFGAVEYLAVHTISLGIYNLWLNLNDLTSATRLAFFTLVVVCSIIFLEHNSRKAQEQFQRESGYYNPPLTTPGPFMQLGLAFMCWLPILLGFMVPIIVLTVYTVKNYTSLLAENFMHYVFNSLALALWAASLASLVGLFVGYMERNQGGRLAKPLGQLVSLGYAIPGTILAIGIIIPFGTFDNWLDYHSEQLWGYRTGLLLSGTGGAIITAYVIRFSAISLGSTRASLKKISLSIDQSAKLFGYTDRQIVTRIHLPLLKKSLLTGFLIIFIDSMKELSATIILRPFNFDTLATYIYAFASDELIEEAAPACLLLVLLGLIPIYLLTRSFIQRQKYDN